MVFIHGGAFVIGDASSYGDIGICENIVSCSAANVIEIQSFIFKLWLPYSVN